MPNPLTQKLSSFADFSAEDRAVLDELASARSNRPRLATLIRDGEEPENVFLLIKGWACRYKLLASGARQITAFLMPGDLCDPHAFLLDRMDQSIGLISNATVAMIPKTRMNVVLEANPTIARAIWLSIMVDEAVLRQWLVNIGKRDAYSRVAHLFCELWERLRHVGMAPGSAFELPTTQEQLGDSLGVTAVHVNRVLQRMRTEGLISLARGRLTINDWAGLRAVAGFDPSYLHLERRRRS